MRFRATFLLLALAAAVAAFAAAPIRARSAADEVRGLWVVRTSLTSAASIQRLVQDARANGFNTLVVQVRGRGDAYFGSGLEPRASALAQQPATFDPLADLLRAAHAAGLRVHAWAAVNLVSSAVTLPAAPDHVVTRHPEWLMVPRALATELRSMSPRDPAYVARLARWTRTQPADVEGLYASPIHPAAASHVIALLADLVRRYGVDGVHLDYVRYPREDFDYGGGALREFRESLAADLPSADRRRLDARSAADPFVYTDAFPERWAAFRRSRLTTLVMRARTALKAVRPELVLSAAVAPDAVEAAANRHQDWALWAQNGLLDAVCPMAYTPDLALFTKQVADAARAVGPRTVWAGIGVYKLDPAQAVAQIQAARRVGAAGYLLFSYDSLAGPGRSSPDYLQRLGRAGRDEAPATGLSR